jgi:hypothetical protein
VALGSPALLEATFDIERARCRAAMRAVVVERPVFVAGLARAGTTILTRMLHEGGGFASAAYRDLPFPLAPNSWARLGGRRQVAASERGHGDGLLHDLDSPEAIEGVFWRCFEGRRYLRPDGLEPIAPEAESVAAFSDYVRLVLLRHGGGRYLSKNNNNVLRIAALREAFPDAVILHPFRDPLQQALSLRAQHWRASTLAGQDPFRRRFMTWLGHHEFGADQRPFRFEGAPEGDPAGVDYWLQAWTSVYGALLRTSPGRFVDFDALCADPARHLPRLGEAIGATLPVETLSPPPPRDGTPDPATLDRAMTVHAMLQEQFRLNQ